ncbi:MAG: MBL fold metallo-hydrolase [Clostridiales bacterium]|nr:MBL fold metallo-hydrolase [Clostridiales bacterium]
MKINVETLVLGEGFEVNCYLAENTETHEVLIIDPGAEAGKIIRAVGDRAPVAALITHGHFDHFCAADEVCERFDIPLYIHELDAPKLSDPVGNESRTFGFNVIASTEPVSVIGGQVLTLGGMEITVLHTPGHSKGGVCYFLPENRGVFCGDTLFHGGYGRHDFGDGNFSELKQSLRKLMNLHPKVVAYPGHGPSTFAGK